ncbi:ABC transporter ATP-binding protein [Bosea sp. LjRoot9]|uniref:ABC transporter ATP-binding protein n=1 Tax=Bosea sp. LjRoot9 TaxID=3342341 RepID=UPI003ECDF0DA
MSEVLLKATALEKRYGGLKAVSGVSIDVHRDEVHAVIGPNGAGKSTLINLLSGDVSISAGAVMLRDRDITALSPDRRARAGVGRSYQKTTIFQTSTVFENVRLAAQAHGGQALRLFGSVTKDLNVNARANSAIAEVGLTHRANTIAKFMSHGEQRQLEIAMVLATEPKVILLDEPLAGMGHAEASSMIALIRRLKQGRAVLLVEHDMDAVFVLADRLTVMADGTVIASGAPDHVRSHPAVRTAYLGQDHGAVA